MSNESNKIGYVISMTHFGSDVDRIAVPLVIANNALAMGEDVLLWVTLDAVQLARKGATDGLQPKSFPAITSLLDSFREAGGVIGVCPPCAKTHGVTDDNLVENARWMGAAAIVEQSKGRHSAWF